MSERSNQSILKEINPEYSLKGLLLELNLQLWPPDAKNGLIGKKKDPDAGKDWRQKERRAAEDEMVRWHHGLNGHESEQTLGYSEGQGSMACCSPWRCKEWDTTWQLNKNKSVSITYWTQFPPHTKLKTSSPGSSSLWQPLSSVLNFPFQVQVLT